MRVHACAWLCMCACMCGGSACVPGHGCACPSVPARARGCIHARVCLDTRERGGVCMCVRRCTRVCACARMCVCWSVQQGCVCAAPHTPRLPPPPAAESSPGWHTPACVTPALPGPAHGRTDGQKEPAVLARRPTGATGSGERCRLPACPAASCLRMLLPLGREDARQQPGFPVLPGGRVGQDVRPRAWTPPAPLTPGLTQPGGTRRSRGPRHRKPPSGRCAARPT